MRLASNNALQPSPHARAEGSAPRQCRNVTHAHVQRGNVHAPALDRCAPLVPQPPSPKATSLTQPHPTGKCPTGAELEAALPGAYLAEPKGATGGMHIDKLSSSAEMDGLQLGTISIQNQRVGAGARGGRRSQSGL